ncbi:hypothetical protein ABIF64_000437 [Bradyrhizobium japonicum]
MTDSRRAYENFVIERFECLSTELARTMVLQAGSREE